MGLSVVSLLWANRQPPNKIISKLTLSHNFHLHVECRFWSTCLMDKWKSHQNWVRTVPTLFLTLAHTHTHAHFLSLSLSLLHTHSHSHSLTHALTRTDSDSRGHSSTPQPSQSTYQQHSAAPNIVNFTYSRQFSNYHPIIHFSQQINKQVPIRMRTGYFLWEVNINHIEHFSNI